LSYETANFLNRAVQKLIYSLTPSLYVSETVLNKTLFLLRTFRDAAGNPHEGIAYWAGVRYKDSLAAMTCVIPDCETGPDFVKVTPMANTVVLEKMGDLGLSLVAQLHTHPGPDTRIDDVDIFYSWKPANSFFYIILPQYGRQKDCFPEACSFYYYMGGRFYRLSGSWLEHNLRIVPSTIELQGE